MIKKYIKGDKDIVLGRIGQVSDITIFVPSSERCMDYLYDALMELCINCVDDDNESFSHIHAIDFYNVILFVNKCCKENNVNINYIVTIMGIMRSFDNLKYVNVVFKNDIKLRESYEKIINTKSNVNENDVMNELTNIYSINMLDIYLGNMFNQDIIDFINKHFISNGIISNSYLERQFLLTFKFDEYVSYINMLIDNNIDRLSMCDGDIIDYLRVFPSIICDISKPDINLYTNYREV
jgi:hypothetical protein